MRRIPFIHQHVSWFYTSMSGKPGRPTTLGNALNLRLPPKAIARLKVAALLRGSTASQLVAELIEAHIPSLPTEHRAPATFTKPVKAKPVPKAKEPKPHKEPKPKRVPKEPGRPSKAKPTAAAKLPAEHRTHTWTWDALVEALDATHTKHSDLRNALGVTNISPWGKHGVPAKWFETITAFLVSRGWTPPFSSPPLLDDDVE